MSSSNNFSSRTKDITPFLAMRLLQESKELGDVGRDIIHLEVGEPDFPTPKLAVQAGIDALQRGHTHYTHSMGIIQLREAICEHYYNMHKVSITPDCVMVSSGSSILLHLVTTLLLEPGDEVIIADTSYACYANFVSIAGGKPVSIPVLEEEGFALSPARVRQAITERTRAIIICSPDNPTGIVIPEENLRQLITIAQESNISIISDEIYHGLSYDIPAVTALKYDQANCFVLNGFSKYFAMTGWRLGYLILPKNSQGTLMRLHQNIVVCAPDFVQHAGVTAIKETISVCEERAKEYHLRLQYLLDALPKIGLPLNYTPSGAFYVLVNVSDYSNDSLALSLKLMREAHVVMTPGIDFGQGGEGYLRISYANSLSNLKIAMERLADFFSSQKKNI